MEEEIWKGLIYNGVDLSYKMEISNYGNLRNVKTKRLYSQTISKFGYRTHCTTNGSKKDMINIRIHRAVAFMFIPNLNELPFINHIDGCKSKNHVDNLEWCTNQENIIHAINMGLMKPSCGEINGGAKLTEEQVIFIKESYIAKHKEFGARALGRKFNVKHSVISRIINNKAWKHLNVQLEFDETKEEVS